MTALGRKKADRMQMMNALAADFPPALQAREARAQVIAARPIDELQVLAKSGASGELICLSPRSEIHVYLQSGRIAWATDSHHPFAFASQLQASAGFDTETFRHVVEECRREKLPLGETLVAWGLATLEVVRASLLHQVSTAIELLSHVAQQQTIFLPRSYGHYDDRLTFDLAEVLVPPPRAQDEPVAQAAAPVEGPAILPERLETALGLLREAAGYLGAAVVDEARASVLASHAREPALSVEGAALADLDFVSAQKVAMAAVTEDEAVEDILVTTSTQYHLIRPLLTAPRIFLFLLIDRAATTLPVARLAIAQAEQVLR